MGKQVGLNQILIIAIVNLTTYSWLKFYFVQINIRIGLLNLLYIYIYILYINFIWSIQLIILSRNLIWSYLIKDFCINEGVSWFRSDKNHYTAIADLITYS